jgi:hypothetical protein
MTTKCSRIALTLCTVAILASGCSRPLTQQEKSALLGTALGLGMGALVGGGSPSGMLAGGLVGGLAGLLTPRLPGVLDGSVQKTNEIEELKRDLAQQRQEIERYSGEDPSDLPQEGQDIIAACKQLPTTKEVIECFQRQGGLHSYNPSVPSPPPGTYSPTLPPPGSTTPDYGHW